MELALLRCLRGCSGAELRQKCAERTYVVEGDLLVIPAKRRRSEARRGGLGGPTPQKKKNTGFYYGGQSMRTTLIVITAFIVVPFFVFRTTKTHVIVHLYPKLPYLKLCYGHGQTSFKSRRFVFAKSTGARLFRKLSFEKNQFRTFVSETTYLWIDRGLKPISGLETTPNRRRTLRGPHVSMWGCRASPAHGLRMYTYIL
jgi:hypothetical protein